MKKWLFLFALLGCAAVAAPRASAQDDEAGDEGAAADDALPDEGTDPPPSTSSTPADAGATQTSSGPSSSGGSSSSGSSSDASSGTAAPMVINVHAGDRDGRRDDEEPPQQSPVDPHELPGESYHHLGVFARGIFAPQFIQNLFVAGGTNGLNAGVGAFYNYRRDGLNIIAEVWWAGFFAAGPFRGLNESAFEMEWVESELYVVFGSLALMWSIPVTSWLAFEIGFGLGFGGVFGGLYRTEAYPDPNTGFTACRGPGDPDVRDMGQVYCDESTATGGEGSYQRRENSPEPYNFSGGVPPLWFWIDLPRLAIRIKPLRQFQIRVEGGFAAYAFYAGGSVALGF